MTSFFTDADLIHIHSHAQALEDGTLHDLSDLAAQAGYKLPVHVAYGAWADAIAWPHDDTSQDEVGRAWDVLVMAAWAVRAAVRRGAVRRGATADLITFTVLRVEAPGEAPEPVDLGIEIGPGDAGEPVFTITAPSDR